MAHGDQEWNHIMLQKRRNRREELINRQQQGIISSVLQRAYLVWSPSISTTKLTTTIVAPPPLPSLSLSGMYSYVGVARARKNGKTRHR